MMKRHKRIWKTKGNIESKWKWQSMPARCLCYGTQTAKQPRLEIALWESWAMRRMPENKVVFMPLLLLRSRRLSDYSAIYHSFYCLRAPLGRDSDRRIDGAITAISSDGVGNILHFL